MEGTFEFLKELKDRGLVDHITNEEKLIWVLEGKKGAYLGIDPTAPSLHLGNYLGLTLLKRFSQRGHKIVVILGGMTASVGDPSFRSEERKKMNFEDIEVNKKGIINEVKRILPEAQIVDNLEFYSDLQISDFIRDMCSQVNISTLLNKEFLKDRLSKGLTLSEFVYPLFQSWDFYELYKEKDICVQLGGSDQWGNITSGIDLIKKKISPDHKAVGLTFPLLLDSSGKKFGKSENNALFLDQNLTSPYVVFQYLINLDDKLIPDYLRKLTFINLNEIESLVSKSSPQNLKLTLIWEIFKNIYDSDTFKKIKRVSGVLFGGGEEDLKSEDLSLVEGNIPTIYCRESINLFTALKDLGFSSSNSETKRLVSSNSIFLFDRCLTDWNTILDEGLSKNGYLVLRKGKKSFGLVCFRC
ncbi:Tyrosyl-tRNA synthetase [Mycoplasma haemocanis str. Illinois]|uniref:Tyrosine--tRNA ligase n=1 Tax=Mycoplasma haemocanis (strain Illinois) TaxID=1111676 RepID=H6N5W4_MYCHN|nr:tyrosine--tRNA ligase [Mycoplasma haemocanis]AEW44879.1 Tyrosyl-tRNA synthetase [Mycoplasma haemocanis str. Illinois]